MTDEQRIKIANLRNSGLGYKKIAAQMNLSENTIKTYCKRHGLGGFMAMQPKMREIKGPNCLNCGAIVEQIPGRKHKKFCSSKCRTKWWNSNLDKVNHKAFYEYECEYCKKPFSVYANDKRKYCCHECYIADRFGGGANE